MKKKTVIKIISLLLAASMAFTPAQVLMAAQTETVETGTELPEGSIQYLDDDNAQEQETSDDGSDDGSPIFPWVRT